MRLCLKAALGAALIVGLTLGSESSASAAELDCTGGPTSQVPNVGCNTTFAGALWKTVNVTSTGTGVINSFVRIGNDKQDETPDAIVDGHNSDGPRLNDELAGHNFARTLGEVPLINIGGVLYYEFLLDINQTSNNPLLALNNVQICLGLVGTLSTADACPTAPVYTMGAFGGGGDVIKMDYNLNSGSGSGDLFMYIPMTTLGTDTSKFVYLFSQFGALTGYANNDGFEEWAVRICGQTYGKKEDAFVLQCATPPTVPEPSSMLLLGGGLLGLAALARRRATRKATDGPNA